MSLEARISRSALSHNLHVLAERSAPAAVMLVVKANGYGHGATDVSLIAYESGIRHFGCLEIDIARDVRRLIPDPTVQLLAWQFTDADDLTDVAALAIDLGIGSDVQLDAVAAAHRLGAEPIRVHLKVDTGLNRNGVPRGEWDAFVHRAVALENSGVITVVGVWTHIAETDDTADLRAHREFESARAIAEEATGRKLFAHLAASSASFRLPEFRFDAVRIGGHAYGIPSFDNITPTEMGLRPVMTLVGTVVADHDDVWGDVASIDGGSVDGVPGYAANRVDVTIGGVRHRVLGVAEDEIIAEGQPVEGTVYLFGDGSNGEQTVREWGDAIGTLGDEITCRIGTSVRRVLVD